MLKSKRSTLLITSEMYELFIETKMLRLDADFEWNDLRISLVPNGPFTRYSID